MWITKVDKLKKIKLFKKNNKFRKRLPKNLLKQKNKKNTTKRGIFKFWWR